jgi:DNA-binding winged helix-turn-helix (wHTH) protein
MLYAEPRLKILHWQYAPESGTLRRHDGTGMPIVLEPRLHALLNFFLEHASVIISKEQLLNSIWGEDQGSDAALMRAVATLRKLLEDQSKPSLFIETHSRKGYCWVAPVESLDLTPEASCSDDLAVAPANLAKFAQQSHEEQLLPLSNAAAMTEAANNLVVDIIESRSRQRFATLRYLCVSVSAVALLCVIFVFLLWRLGREAYIPSFPYQMNISALPGEEIEPLASIDRQFWFYWYRPEGSKEWRLISHDRQTHRKIMLVDGFLQAGQLHWFGDTLAFVGVNQQGCGIFSQSPSAPNQLTKVASCERFTSKGLAVVDRELHWLDQSQATSQLWRWHQQEKQLLTTVSGVFRQPTQLIYGQGQFLLLLQEHQQSYQLFSWKSSDLRPSPIASFALEIQNISWWDEETLLLSGSEKLQLFTLSGKRLLALNTHAGLFADMQRLDDGLLGTVRQNPSLDLVPFQPTIGPRRAELNLPQWLTSNRDDWLYAGDGVFLSTRSGFPQIWRFADGHLRQLTKFKSPVTMSQLLWQGGSLFVVVDQHLLQVDLSRGELSQLPWSTGASRRYASCHGQWFWTEQDENGWALYQLVHEQPKKLIADVVDVRCGPESSLVLQYNKTPSLHLYSLVDASLVQLPITMDWRNTATDLWGVNQHAIFWIDDKHQLNQFNFNQKIIQSQQLPASMEPEALYVTEDEAMFYLLQRRSKDKEVVRLQTSPIIEH